jgi:hypothetical protein
MSNAEIVNAWFHEKIANGPIARDTPAYNQAFAAKADLIARLDAVSASSEDAPKAVSLPVDPRTPCAGSQPEPAADAASEKE